jgi:hypothetical protein
VWVRCHHLPPRNTVPIVTDKTGCPLARDTFCHTTAVVLPRRRTPPRSRLRRLENSCWMQNRSSLNPRSNPVSPNCKSSSFFFKFRPPLIPGFRVSGASPQLTSFELVFLGPSRTPLSSPEPQHLHLKKTRTTPCRPLPHTELTPRPRTPPVHLQVAVVVAATATTSVRGRQTRLHHLHPRGPHAVRSPHRSDPSTAHAARPPTSGGGGGGDGDDFGAWATNTPPPPAPARTTPCRPLPPPIRPLDRTRRPSTYKWRWWWRRRRRLRCVGDKRASTICTREDDPMPSAPPTDPTPRPHTPPVHLQVAVVVAATATTSVRGRQTRLHHGPPDRRIEGKLPRAHRCADADRARCAHAKVLKPPIVHAATRPDTADTAAAPDTQDLQNNLQAHHLQLAQATLTPPMTRKAPQLVGDP